MWDDVLICTAIKIAVSDVLRPAVAFSFLVSLCASLVGGTMTEETKDASKRRVDASKGIQDVPITISNQAFSKGFQGEIQKVS